MNNRLNNRERAHLVRIKACCEPECHRPMLARGMCATHYMRQRRAGLLQKTVETSQEYISKRVKAEGECWLWTLSTHNGYGKCGFRGRARPAHVVAFEAWKGQVPEGLQVNHTCHNRACCNPMHLYAGTQAQNMADMRAAGRENVLRGEQSGMSKLNEQVVRAIRSSAEPAKVLRMRYGVSDTLIRAVRKNLIWRHVA